MFGLEVRWQLPAGTAVADQLREYVVGTSLARFTAMPGLIQKTWRMRPGEWFEGTYVFASAESRAAFATAFQAGADTAPGSLIVGAPPTTVATFEVVAVAAGAEPMRPGPGPGRGAEPAAAPRSG